MSLRRSTGDGRVRERQMRQPDEREIDRFDAADEDGRLYTVVHLEKVSFPRSITGGLPEMPGSKRFELSSGESVNHIEGDTFQVVQSGQVIFRKVR
jgi:hypothetical protein